MTIDLTKLIEQVEDIDQAEYDAHNLEDFDDPQWRWMRAYRALAKSMLEFYGYTDVGTSA